MENRKSAGNIIAYILLFLISIGVVLLGSIYYKIPLNGCIRLAFYIIFSQILIIFCFHASILNGNLFENNSNYFARFCFSYIICLILSLCFTVMPSASWPYAAIFAILVLMSNITTGIMAGTVCLLISLYFNSSEFTTYFMLYFLCGILTGVLVGHLDKEFKIGFPLLISVISLVTGFSVIILTSNDGFLIDHIINPAINIVITLILLFVVLKIYYEKVIYVHSNRYIDINDPECELLTRLKSESNTDYLKSVHVAYFCDRIAKRLQLDENILKCSGYYHRCGVIKGEYNWENTYEMCIEGNLPDEVIDILSEFLNNASTIVKTESAILYMSECIVSSVIYLYSKNKEMKLDIPSLIEAIFKQRLESGIFNKCNISLHQIETMKKVFIEEKLYYDFLR